MILTDLKSTDIARREQPRDDMDRQRRSEKLGLDALFTPDTVAAMGATDRAGTVGRTVRQNLLVPGFRGTDISLRSP
jgi:hypothetical protein